MSRAPLAMPPLACVCLLAAFCLSCSRGSNARNFAPRSESLDAVDPGPSCIVYGDAIIALEASGPVRVGAWPGDARPRDSFAYPGGCVAWDRATGRVMRYEDGALAEIGRIEGAELFLSADRAVVRSAPYEAGRGFLFSVYELGSDPRAGIEFRSSFTLDCVPADAAFMEGRVYLAGADRADSRNSLYEIEPDTGMVRTIAELPKNRDFGRLVAQDQILWYYLSPAFPRRGPISVLRFLIDPRLGASEPEVLDLSGLPAAMACPYGSAFAYEGLFWVPIASGEASSTRVRLVAFDPAAHAPRPKAFVDLDSGSYAAIGESAGGFWIFGFLYVRDPAAFSLVRIRNGEALSTPLSTLQSLSEIL